MVLQPDAVAHPRTVVIESRHTAIAHGAVFGPNRAAHQATGAEGGGLKADSTSLRKLYDGLWGKISCHIY